MLTTSGFVTDVADASPRASRGMYLVGFHRFTAREHELARIMDFVRAPSIDDFIGGITGD